MNPSQVAVNHQKRVERERREQLDAALFAKPRVSYSTWTGKPSRVEKEEK